jgi:hypothetical protein
MQAEADSKRYESAKNYAAEAIATAEKALTDGKSGASRARDEAARLLSALKPEIDETESSLSAAKEVPNIKLDFNTLDNDLSTAKSAYNGAESSFNTGNYKEVTPRAQPIRPLLSGIRLQINDATLDLSRKK